MPWFMTHLASVADRIDRSYSPWGGREERDLEICQRNIPPKRGCNL